MAGPVDREVPGMMSPSSSPQYSSSEHPRSISAHQLRAMWRVASRDRGWRFPDDWWTPAVDAVAEAIVSDGDIAERCLRLGRARARAGVSMEETISDVIAIASLTASLLAHPAHRATPSCREVDIVQLVRCAAIGWSEESDLGSSQQHAVTPTALPDCAYLSIRLGEIAAEVESMGRRLGQEYAFVVASLLGPSRIDEPRSHYSEVEPDRPPAAGSSFDDGSGLQARVEAWDHAWQMSQLVDELRAVFSSGETLVQAGPTTAIVLARRTPQLTDRVAALRELIEARRLDAAQPASLLVGIWVEGLPDSLRQARLLVSDLRR